AFAGATNSYGKIAVGMSSSISYIRPPQGNKLFATAKEISRTRQTGVYEIQTHDESGRVITQGLFTAFFTDKLFPAFKSPDEIAE
ncbi:MAG: hotdog fold thioesterase, partial [Victivallaceae bacterium]